MSTERQLPPTAAELTKQIDKLSDQHTDAEMALRNMISKRDFLAEIEGAIEGAHRFLGIELGEEPVLAGLGKDAQIAIVVAAGWKNDVDRQIRVLRNRIDQVARELEAFVGGDHFRAGEPK